VARTRAASRDLALPLRRLEKRVAPTVQPSCCLEKRRVAPIAWTSCCLERRRAAPRAWASCRPSVEHLDLVVPQAPRSIGYIYISL
jgi:hypothetical protein